MKPDPVAAKPAFRIASRFEGVDISIVRQISALATPLTVNLGLGESNVLPDDTLRALAIRAAHSGSWRYTPNAGSQSLRNAIGEHLAPGLDPATEICVTAGTQEGLYSILQTFVDQGDEVLVPDPGFLYDVLIRIAGGEPRYYPLDPAGWRLDLDELTKRITDRTRAILVNSPSNPTGAVIDEPTLRALAEITEERGILVISDEVYSEIYYENKPPSMLGMGDHIIVLGGMSKSHSMTGLRLGWALGHQSLMTPVIRAHQYVTTCASTFSQTLAELVLQNREWNTAWLHRVRSQLRAQRDAALEAVDEHLHVPLPKPAGAFYLFVPVPACQSLPLARALVEEASVVTIPGIAFGAGGEGFLRIACAASIGDIHKGIGAIGNYFAKTLM